MHVYGICGFGQNWAFTTWMVCQLLRYRTTWVCCTVVYATALTG